MNMRNVRMQSFVDYVHTSRYQMVPDNSTGMALEFLAVSNALGGEVGELQNIVKKIIREGVFDCDSTLHDKFVLEAGDALHYLLSLIDLAGYNLDFIIACNVQKLDNRKQAQIEAQEAAVLSTTPVKSAT